MGGNTWSRHNEFCCCCFQDAEPDAEEVATTDDEIHPNHYTINGGELRVGMFGLNNAGKTTILYQLKMGVDTEPAPTVGFNVENIEHGPYLFNIWDVSVSNPKTRPLWQHYNHRVRVIIFVVDAADVVQLDNARSELHALSWQTDLAKAVFLIFANKQDLAMALKSEEIITALQLTKLSQRWAVQECCARNQNGLWLGLHQIVQLLAKTSNKCTINRFGVTGCQ